MQELLEKLSSYNIFNYLLPGVLFAVIGSEVSSFQFLVDEIVLGVFLYYFYGVVVSRVGSLALEPLLKLARIVTFAPYGDFVKASRLDSKIETLSEVNNSYRSLASLFFCLALLALIDQASILMAISPSAVLTIAVLALFALFVASYRKQTSYIRDRVSTVLESKHQAEDQTESEE